MPRKHVTDENEDGRPELWDGERATFYKRIFSALDPDHTHSPDPAVIGVMWRLGYTMHLMMAASDDFLKPYNLTSAKFRMLTWLLACEKAGFSDGLLPSQLSHFQGISPNTVSALMDGLQEQGLIQRIRHPTDHRKRIITITDAGRDRLGHIGVAYKHFAEATIAGLSPDERQTLAGLLDKLADSIRAAQAQGDHTCS
ncbi:MAG: MarR family winged helix-turn-helix transcriptional regulator [Aggregatilineales bacterium]